MKKKSKKAIAEMQEMARLWLELPKDPLMDHLFYEWARQIETEEDATALVNLFMEWWIGKDNPPLSKACIILAILVRYLDWTEILVLLEPKLGPAAKKAFRLSYAKKFYQGFRAMMEQRIQWYVETHSKNEPPKEGNKVDLT